MWIDNGEMDTVGTIGYLVETSSNGSASFSLRERPLRTNQSLQPRLFGWCGETDNKSRTARGVWRIDATNKSGDRAKISKLAGSDLAEFLERDGYPELIPVSAQAATEPSGRYASYAQVPGLSPPDRW